LTRDRRLQQPGRVFDDRLHRDTVDLGRQRNRGDVTERRSEVHCGGRGIGVVGCEESAQRSTNRIGIGVPAANGGWEGGIRARPMHTVSAHSIDMIDLRDMLGFGKRRGFGRSVLRMHDQLEIHDQHEIRESRMSPRVLYAGILVLIAAALVTVPSKAETPEEWIQLGTRVHGFFGGFIPVGIRIGLDAKERLKAEPRGLSILYYQGEKAPCPCVVDGVMLATEASPGQGTVQVSTEKAPAGLLAVIVIRNRKTGETLRYTIADEWLSKMLGLNKLPPLERYDEAMQAEGLFRVEPYAAH